MANANQALGLTQNDGTAIKEAANFERNDVLSCNLVVMPADYPEYAHDDYHEPRRATIRKPIRAVDIKIATHKAQADELADHWNSIKGCAIVLKAQAGKHEGYRMVGHWLKGLPTLAYNQELDCEVLADMTMDCLTSSLEAVFKTPTETTDTHLIARLIKEHFATHYFQNLKGTSFFKHINKMFNEQRIESCIDSTMTDLYGNYEEQWLDNTSNRLNLMHSSFRTHITDNPNALMALINAFELEQVAYASAKAGEITIACR